jgi:transcriptional regulator with XRE-family HTH domain
MRDLELGRLVRALRRRRGWRQLDCASRAGVHRSTWSRLERGHFDQLSLGAIRSCLAVVEVRLDLLPRWRGADLDRLLDENHATLANTLHRRLESWGWTVRAEVSFNHYGDRGRVDLVGRHAATGTLLIVEIKTEITDVQQVLGSLDIKQRLAGVVAHEAGWAPPTRVGVLLLVAESTTNRRRVERLAPLSAASASEADQRLGGCASRFRMLSRCLRSQSCHLRMDGTVGDSRRLESGCPRQK